ncbi:FAD:protein FMN transferase [Uliginosibacterium gangwonense]|uniref:FAD:protein FMN transferase n=1 Tax=Uliginosibacterium gangwonense TaxID=392736 RepID=UPI000372216C|nr:FAD:protein FMN transferase [Uliginosibacterium gangwonense]
MRRRFSTNAWFGWLAGLICLCLLGCSPPQPVRQESFVFGTRVEVVALGASEPQLRDALGEVLREFDRLHRTFHPWQASDLTTLNAAFAKGEAREVSDEMLFLIRASQRYAKQGDYLFDPAIGKLIQLWGFHTDNFVPHLPSPEAVEALRLAHPSIADLDIDGHRVSSRNKDVELDFGGIAKGYALDRAREILLRRGVKNALINIGGNVMALGDKNGQAWTVGIQHPRRGGAMATLALYDGEAIGTSGDYQRFFDVAGQRYCHLIDPRTAAPVRHTQAVTILITPQANAGMLSDVASKPVFLAADAWRAMASRMGVSHVLRVAGDGKIAVTEALRARLRWADDIKPDQVVP